MTLSGFKYAFDSLNPEDSPSALYGAFRKLLSAGAPGLVGILLYYLPILGILVRYHSLILFLVNADYPLPQPTKRERLLSEARSTIYATGRELLASMKASIVAEHGTTQQLGRKDFAQRDVLSMLVKANMAKDVPEDIRMSDEDILAR